MRLKKLVILDWATMSFRKDELSLRGLQGLAEETEIFLSTEPQQAAERIGYADGVLCNKVPITREVLDVCPNLRYIGVLATGFNNVDTEAAKERNIPVCNAGSYSTDAVTQLVFAYILDRTQKIGLYSSCVRSGEWESSPVFSYFPYPTGELRGRTLSIIGYGRIGQSVARVAEAFGMTVLVHTRTPRGDYPNQSLEEVLKRGDFVTLHCPLTDQTARIINRQTLGFMKETAVLINTARGGLVDEQALADALNEDRISAAYLDVLDKEPMRPSTPLGFAKNCIITPHIGWTPVETRKRLLAVTEDNLRGWLCGNPQNVVNGAAGSVIGYRNSVAGPSVMPEGYVPHAEDRIIRPLSQEEQGSGDMEL